ncbi:MAG: hypothetical protein Q8L47_03355 [bacterium]|nr:hypothetical protein [bacterium]
MIKKAKEKSNNGRSEEHRIGVMLEHMDSIEKVSRDEFVVLEKRVAMIEKKMHSQ